MTDDTERPIFGIAANDDTHLFLTTTETAPDGKYRILWDTELKSMDSRNAFVAWLGQREDRWEEWRRYAEEYGGQALHDRFLEMIAIKPLELWWGAKVNRTSDGVTIEVMAELQTRQVLVLRHRFTSDAACNRLFERIMANDPAATPFRLVAEGWLRGKVALAALLDEIGDAAAPSPGNRHARRSRRHRQTIH